MTSKTYYRPNKGKHRWHRLHYGLVGQVGKSLCGILMVRPNRLGACRSRIAEVAGARGVEGETMGKTARESLEVMRGLFADQLAPEEFAALRSAVEDQELLERGTEEYGLLDDYAALMKRKADKMAEAIDEYLSDPYHTNELREALDAWRNADFWKEAALDAALDAAPTKEKQP